MQKFPFNLLRKKKWIFSKTWKNFFFFQLPDDGFILIWAKKGFWMHFSKNQNVKIEIRKKNFFFLKNRLFENLTKKIRFQIQYKSSNRFQTISTWNYLSYLGLLIPNNPIWNSKNLHFWKIFKKIFFDENFGVEKIFFFKSQNEIFVLVEGIWA